MELFGTNSEGRRAPLYGLILMIAVIIGYSIWLHNFNTNSASITMNDTAITISYEDQETAIILLSDISGVEMTGNPSYQLRDFGTLESGVLENNLYYGRFVSEEEGSYFACANPKLKYYIQITTSDGMYLINLNSDKDTSVFCQEILEAIDK